MKPVEFAGRVIIIGSGSIGQGMVPLIGRHFTLEGEKRLLVLSADEQGRGLARKHGALFEHTHLTPANHRRVLGRHVKAGDLVMNLVALAALWRPTTAWRRCQRSSSCRPDRPCRRRSYRSRCRQSQCHRRSYR